MPIDDRNANLLWSSILVETCCRAGVVAAVICPGSRSGPLALAFAAQQQHGDLAVIPILDERTAAFFALGMAKRTGQPVAVVCSSGTAGANFFPAVIEARQSRVPLLILTADRPPELRDCHAGQAIDQAKLYGHYVNSYCELALPEPRVEMLQYLRQTVANAIARSQLPVPGPVHLNVPFRDPLAPLPESFPPVELGEDFFARVAPPAIPLRQVPVPWSAWRACPRGAIVAGVTAPTDPEAYCKAVSRLAAFLGWPVLADGLSPLRNWAACNPNLIATYDLALRNWDLAEGLQPDCVLQLGPLPTSKVLRAWLENTPGERWIVDAVTDNYDPLHGLSQQLSISVVDLAANLPELFPNPDATEYFRTWLQVEKGLQAAIAQTMVQSSFEPMPLEAKVAWILGHTLSANTPLVVANSTPIRDVESFWPPNDRHHPVFCNRGANGIDGTLSTALGIAWGDRAVLLTGDLALLHDTNGFLIARQLQGHLTIVLINNNGGGIFEMLPMAAYNPPFEEFFATPQNVDFTHLCATYGVAHERIADWSHLETCLRTMPSSGVRVLEVICDRRAAANWRRTVLPNLAADSNQTLERGVQTAANSSQQ